jgi:hypothetical protein
MISDLDILRTAKLLLDQHGKNEAFQVASLRMEELALAGDLEGMEAFSKIMLAITALSADASARVLH